jgi:hypothetical protein
VTLILPERHVAEDLSSHRAQVEEGFGEIGGSVVVGDDLKRFERGDLAPNVHRRRHAAVTTVAKLDHYSFSRMVVDGQEHTRDLIVLPGRVVPIWWRQEGHSLVVQDLEEVRHELPERMIVGCGALGKLKPTRRSCKRSASAASRLRHSTHPRPLSATANQTSAAPPPPSI